MSSSVEEDPAGLEIDMMIERDIEVHMNDGAALRADVFRPQGPGQHGVLMSYGPYGKGLPFQTGYPTAWDRMVQSRPEVARGTSARHMNWEVADPERWVPHGYALVRIDSRGAGRSPGHLNPNSEREIEDLYDCIEWAADQEWSNGKIGLLGISYYASNQWRVAALNPPHLAAMCAWEGNSDFYREAARHGGILSTMPSNWYDMQVIPVQYGRGESGPVNPETQIPICGDETLDEQTLESNRVNLRTILREGMLESDVADRRSDLSRIEVPLLSAANWGGQGLHLRGNVEGFVQASSQQKWLEFHANEHWTEFYTDYGIDLQRRFFDHFLLGRDNGWDQQPPVILNVRHADGSLQRRDETGWPIPGTQYTDLVPTADGQLLSMHDNKPATVSFEAMTGATSFETDAFEEAVEITGPLCARLHVSSTTEDADLFLIVRLFNPEGHEQVFQGATDANSAVTKGWLRVSHRELDPDRSLSYRPYHRHTRRQLLTPNEIYPVDIEIWPTSIVVPAGWRLMLTVQGADWFHADATSDRLSNFKNDLRGSGPFLHNDPVDRPEALFGGTTTIHLGPEFESYLRLPIIPE